MRPPKCIIHPLNQPSPFIYQRIRHKSTSSTKAKGDHFERVVQHSLGRLGFQLTRVGRSNDRGIDLIGSWMLPRSRSLISKSGGNLSGNVKTPAFVQCKFLAPSGKISPMLVREVEGAFPGLLKARAVAMADAALAGGGGDDSASLVEAEASSGGSSVERSDTVGGDDRYGPPSAPKTGGEVKGAVGFLATTRPATKGVRDAIARSSMPLGYLQIVPVAENVVVDGSDEESSDERSSHLNEGQQAEDHRGRILQLLWNAKAAGLDVAEGALRGCDVGVRYLDGTKDREIQEEIVLLRDGEVWRGSDDESFVY